MHDKQGDKRTKWKGKKNHNCFEYVQQIVALSYRLCLAICTCKMFRRNMWMYLKKKTTITSTVTNRNALNRKLTRTNFEHITVLNFKKFLLLFVIRYCICNALLYSFFAEQTGMFRMHWLLESAVTLPTNNINTNKHNDCRFFVSFLLKFFFFYRSMLKSVHGEM